MKPSLVALAVAAALTGCGSEARAPAPDARRVQDLVPLTTAQAARRAQRVAIVVAGGTRVVEGAPGTPFTRTTFSVQRVLKGELPRRFVVQTIGGRLGDVVVPSPLPAFAPARRYVLFLGPDGPAGPTIFPQSVIALESGDAARAVIDDLRGDL